MFSEADDYERASTVGEVIGKMTQLNAMARELTGMIERLPCDMDLRSPSGVQDLAADTSLLQRLSEDTKKAMTEFYDSLGSALMARIILANLMRLQEPAASQPIGPS